jgi:two-component system, chemotaxis family, sensor kinase CheA
MSDFGGMEELLGEFLLEASEMLSDVDNKLVDLEKYPDDHKLLNDIFRGFHTIKGGAGFLAAHELVHLCHLTENLFDKLRTGSLKLDSDLMDVILEATQGVRYMFGELERKAQPTPASQHIIDGLNKALGNEVAEHHNAEHVEIKVEVVSEKAGTEVNWQELHDAVRGSTVIQNVGIKQEVTIQSQPAQVKANSANNKQTKSAPPTQVRDTTIRIDTNRLDQVLNLSGEIGLTKNRLTSLRTDILNGKNDAETMAALDAAVSQLDLLVSDLQNSVMKTRMQPIGRLFQKYPRIARDLARQLGKDVDLVLVGEETEIDKTMIDDLSDPLIHLVRNAVDHGVETTEERIALGKSEKSTVRLEAKQEGDHIMLIISDDGKGMDAEKIKAKAIEKKLITQEEALSLDERQSLNLIFLPGFSTKTEISDVSGRGVGMDVVKTNIQKLNGSIDIKSQVGVGSSFIISLPLTLAILPVLLVTLNNQPFALPLSLVREIMPIREEEMQSVGGKDTLVVRGEIIPVVPMARILGWENFEKPKHGIVMVVQEKVFMLGVDTAEGREDAVIKSLDSYRPKGIAGVTTLATGEIVLITDMKELFNDLVREL